MHGTIWQDCRPRNLLEPNERSSDFDEFKGIHRHVGDVAVSHEEFDVVKDGEKEDKRGEAFEEKILEIIRELEEELSSTVSVEYAVTRSFGDEFGSR